MAEQKHMENLTQKVKQLEDEVKQLKAVGIVKYKKCFDCTSDLVPPLKIVNISTDGFNVAQYIVCPICLSENATRSEVIPTSNKNYFKFI